MLSFRRNILALSTCTWILSLSVSLAQNENVKLSPVHREALLALEQKVETGDLVLREDYFRDKFKELHEFPGPPPAPPAPPQIQKLTLRDTLEFLKTINEVSKAMLNAAKPDRNSSDAYQTAWLEEESAILARMGDISPTFVPDLGQGSERLQIWTTFLRDWRADVVRQNPDRFRDALRQAAYSMLRLGLDIEDGWIKAVREQGNIAVAADTGTYSSVGASSSYGGHHRHYRIMRRIERHHYRRSP
ncbi:MAG: hypothetical protein IAF94_26360 [Pirellulaceae bacterium]|nr:hypothetical protein [Pirellulaceae bacterium]